MTTPRSTAAAARNRGRIEGPGGRRRAGRWDQARRSLVHSSRTPFRVAGALAEDDAIAVHARDLDGGARLDEAAVGNDVDARAINPRDTSRPQWRKSDTGTTELLLVAFRRRRVASLSAHLGAEHESAAERDPRQHAQ